MSGGSSSLLRAMYDLLIYWFIALISTVLGKPIRCPPLLFYLIFGSIAGNLHWVERGEAVQFFSEFSITIVFFSLGFEETVEHFMHGIKQSWGIALIGAIVPFGSGYLAGYLLWPQEHWTIHLTIATAVTATAVSLTMIVLQSVGLSKCKAAMGIMTSAVLDDVGCLILVAILIPIILGAKPPVQTVSGIDDAACETNLVNVSGHLGWNSTAIAALTEGSPAWVAFASGLRNAIANHTGVPPSLVALPIFRRAHGTTTTLSAEYEVAPVPAIGLDRDHLLARGLGNVSGSADWWAPTAAALGASDLALVTANVTPYSASVGHGDGGSHSGVSVGDIFWIIGKVVIFFVIVALLHNVILPDTVTEGIVSHIPFFRTFGIRHLLSFAHGEQTALMIVLFGLGLGIVGAALGFHPAVGAYFGGLILEEAYFNVFVDEEELTHGDEEKSRNVSRRASTVREGATVHSRREGPSRIGARDSNVPVMAQPVAAEPATTTSQRSDKKTLSDDTDGKGGKDWEVAPAYDADGGEQPGMEVQQPTLVFEPANPVAPPTERVTTEGCCGEHGPQVLAGNTMERAKDTVGNAAFMWLGPVFFVNLGAGLTVRPEMLAKAVPQALAITALLYVGQFVSAALAARYVPGGFSWYESALVGFGMLGRAELYFVVLNIGKTEGIIPDEIFFPMALAAMLMNVTLPISISAFRPFYVKRHPPGEDPPSDDELEFEPMMPMHGTTTDTAAAPANMRDGRTPAGSSGAQPRQSRSGRASGVYGVGTGSRLVIRTPAEAREARGSELSRRSGSAITRRGIGMGGVELNVLDPAGPQPSQVPARRLDREGSRLVRRSLLERRAVDADLSPVVPGPVLPSYAEPFAGATDVPSGRRD